MGINTAIQWTDNSHNFWEGCNKVDADCKYCYAERMFARFGKDFATLRKVKNFEAPIKWKEPKKIFTCSTSDFFHIKADGWRDEAWDIIRKCPQHTFQILTKRPERIVENLPDFWNEIRGRCWIGTSIGSVAGMHRLKELMETGIEAIKFLSIEPLHERIYLPFEDMNVLPDWVIVGGESGNENGKYGYRPCNVLWIDNIISSCKAYKIPVFVKQLGTHLAKEMGLKDRHGGDINEWPEYLRIREFPI